MNYGVVLLWGERSTDEQYQASRGNAILGGSNLVGSLEDRQCRRCGRRWISSDIATADGSAKHVEVGRDACLKHEQNTVTGPQRAKLKIPPPVRYIKSNRDEPQLPGRRGISLFPTITLFVLVWIVGLLLVADIVCSDGWVSASIGRSGACSHHGGVGRIPYILALVAAVVAAANFHSFRQRRADRRNR
jgi:hypothetical protein